MLRPYKFRAELATAYELNDFVAVTWLDLGFWPLGAGQDLQIAFDGYAAGVET
jgi:hypothetical protein